jgi:hypothetical protein
MAKALIFAIFLSTTPPQLIKTIKNLLKCNGRAIFKLAAKSRKQRKTMLQYLQIFFSGGGRILPLKERRRC